MRIYPIPTRTELRHRFAAVGRPMITKAELARCLGLGYQGLAERFRNYPEGLPQPVTMRIGGADMMTTDNALEWATDHLKRWAAIQAAKKEAA